MENKQKTTVFNLIILDESGSMEPLRDVTISGCNETVDTVIAAQKEYADTQNQFLSIYAFQSGDPHTPSRYLLHNAKGESIRHITKRDYKPNGMTPLYDAVGDTVNSLLEVAATHEDAVGVVTIITDGYENSSLRYSHSDIAKLIAGVKEMGWQVNFIGANVEVEKVAAGLNIMSAARFDANPESTRGIFNAVNSSSNAVYAKLEEEYDYDRETKLARRKKRWNNFFKHPDSK